MNSSPLLYSSREANASYKVIVDYAKLKQMVLEPGALVDLDKTNYIQIIDQACDDGFFVITKEYIANYKRLQTNIIPVDEKPMERIEVPDKFVEVQRSKHIYAQEIDADIKIKHECDVTGKLSTIGKISEFQEYFRDRYDTLGGMLRKRFSVQTSRDLNKHIQKNEDITLLGMVKEKNITKNGNILVQLDDLEGEFKAVIMQKDPVLFDAGLHIANDDVILVKGVKLGEGIVIVNDISYPDMPNRTFRKGNRECYAIAISDMHLGSKLFYEDAFQRFIDWVSLKNNDDFDIVEKIKYLFVPGDIVDGIGVYPQQINELKVFDIYEQYERITAYLEQIPEYIQIIIGPGNHDAVRLADPQPAVSKEYAKQLYEMKNVHMVGSPGWLEVEGLKTLLYHGSSMFSIQGALKLEKTKPELTMKEMLRRRDLSPIFGARHPILPEKGGYMLIKEEPDLFLTGHIHSNGYDNYKGCVLINPGTWQGQTIYQVEQGHVPTPGRVPIINLSTGKINEKVFIDGVKI